ncbi:MAG: type II secretion system protein [Epsilonproteobacteria bacterium]|nr:type II secretion system protein [Campylobacterota bacterium]
MKRAGFTMIELIFVIVILGILAAVALPKFIGVSDQAHVGKLKGYVGTLDRTVGPALWSQSITNGDDGAVNTATYNTLLTDQIESPAELGGNDPDLTKCAAAGTTKGKDVGTTVEATVGSTTYQIGCINGSASAAPDFFLWDKTNDKSVLD